MDDRASAARPRDTDVHQCAGPRADPCGHLPVRHLVRLYPSGTAGDEAAAAELVVGQVERLCGVAEAAPLRPVTVDTEELLESVRDAASLRSFLLRQNLDVDQLHIVTLAADPARRAHQ